jgi:hypothetical protein
VIKDSNGRFKQKYDHISFVKAAKELWNNRFVYLSNFESMRKKILIKCNICLTEFKQRPYSHLQGVGCRTCSFKTGHRRIPFTTFVSRSISKFGHNFSFDENSYRGIRFKVKLTCLKCKNCYTQVADTHLRGFGCHFCINHETSKSETAWLDQLLIPHDCRNITIIDPHGKTKRNKFKVDALYHGIVYEFYGKYYHGDPREYPGDNKHESNKVSFGELYTRTLIRQAKLEALNYPVRYVWELDWKLGQQFSDCHPHEQINNQR